jgi:hypothetical protein
MRPAQTTAASETSTARDSFDNMSSGSSSLEKEKAEMEDDVVAPLPAPSPAPPRRPHSLHSLARSASRASRTSRLSRTSTRMSGLQATQLEMMLRSQTREEGVLTHAAGEGEGRGVVEKHTVLDFGDGPEDVVIIDWAPGDPEVSASFESSDRSWPWLVSGHVLLRTRVGNRGYVDAYRLATEVWLQ